MQPGVKIQNVRVFNEADRSVEITYQLKKKERRAESGEKESGERGAQSEKRGGEEKHAHKAEGQPDSANGRKGAPGAIGTQEGKRVGKREGREEASKGE